MRLPHTRTLVFPSSVSMPSSEVSKMSLPKMSTLVPGVEIPSATRVMLLWATVWLFAPHAAN